MKTTETPGPRGYDAGKKVKGRKRHILVDTLGLILATRARTGTYVVAEVARLRRFMSNTLTGVGRFLSLKRKLGWDRDPVKWSYSSYSCL